MDNNELRSEKIKSKRVSLNSLDNITKFMARKIREFENDPEKKEKIPEYRAVGYLVNILIGGYKVQYEQEIERRLERIEIQLEGQK